MQIALSDNSLTILKKRYLRKDENGDTEIPEEMFRRVAQYIAEAETSYGVTEAEVRKLAIEFYNAMANLLFLPNSPTLRGANRRLGQLSACFVLPIGDSIEEIFYALQASVLVHKTGGGTGFSFSLLRPNKDIVSSTGNVAGGPISFMRIFDQATQEITQGGVRIGANMAVLSVDHPDIMAFITCKADGQSLKNFNISVALTDTFMQAVEDDTEYNLINPRTQETVDKLKARSVLDAIATEAHRTGDPGVLFIDEINRKHPAAHLGPITSTNPCGEQPLLPYESCNLGSINLFQMITDDNKIDWSLLKRIVRLAIHFLDNVIDQNKFVLPEIENSTIGTRKVGLGVMGFADMLIKLGIPYNSNEALSVADQVMEFIDIEARQKSIDLAEKKGGYPYAQNGNSIKVRNACRTTIAPTGTIGVIAGASGGIEPIFAVVYKRETLFDKHGSTETLLVVNSQFEAIAKERGFYSAELLDQIAKVGSIQGFDKIPEDVKRLFVTAHDISAEFHVRMQATFQQYIDAAVSKTINFPNSATVKQVKQAYLLAYKEGCKGITIYRDGSRHFQVLHTVKEETTTAKRRPTVLYGTTYRKLTPIGTAYITININSDKDPFEVFINVAKVGSDVAADAEGLGRLISLILRMPSSLSTKERVQVLIAQLRGIGSGQQRGFGKQRVMSLPDAIAQVLAEQIGFQPDADLPGLPDEEDRLPQGDLCPTCGNATLLMTEGCKSCYSCGFSMC